MNSPKDDKPVVPCTNEDLKRLKQRIYFRDFQVDDTVLINALLARLESSEAQRDAFREMYERKEAELSAFIKRLEAAEALEPYWRYYGPVSERDEKEYDAKVEAWKKEARKDGRR